MRSATVPPRVGGNFDVLRSDFSEIAGYLLLADQYGTRFGYQGIRDRETIRLPGRGIDAVGVESGEKLVLVLGEVKASEESASPPRVVDRNDDCLRNQHRSHLNQRKSTIDKVWDLARRFSNLSESSQRFARLLASRGRPRPVLELWPSQQAALGENLLDPYRKAILVEMPTSAGKTLLAKFAIVQTQTLNPSGTIAYVVPTRALVNQVTFDLRADFQELGFQIEQAVPAFELDPMETRLLQTPPTVLVTTPEKLDLLVRRDHPAAQNLTLVIADEAHNLDDQNRGPRLELLLGTIKRDRPSARFLLLSPFLPNDEELVTWLGEERRLPPIKVDWKPGRKIVGSVNVLGRASNRHLVFETLPAADNADLPSGKQIVLGPPAPKTVKGITKATVESAVERGSVLVLCGGPDSAMTRASELAEDVPDVDVDQYMTAVIHYLDAEIGRPSLLTQCLRRGVAYHHSGLSQEARWLVEGLIRRGNVRIVCGTTTLAQGVNFPITTVVVESLRKGRDSELSYADFWNIAGRAGRALVDTVGLIAFPAPDAERRQQYETFLRGEAQEISSQLARLIDRADEIEDSFSLSTIERWPELSSLLQFLAHAMKVSGKTQVAEDVEDLLRASLVYHQARRDSEERAQRLVDLCRSYLLHIEDRTDILPLADQTGFATPSVLALLGQRSSLPELTSRANWKPANLFGENLSTLTLCIQSISGLPEIQLSEGRGRPFDPQRVAAILRDWVQGATLEQLTNDYSLENPDTPTDKRIAHFTRYLFSTLLGQASWGLGALEAVYLGDTRDAATGSANEEGYVPSMVFFGVHQPEAVWMRMVGVPRVVANGVAALWRQSEPSEPDSFQELRGWVNQLTDAAWTQAIPADSQLTASDMKLLWNDFVGAGVDLPA